MSHTPDDARAALSSTGRENELRILHSVAATVGRARSLDEVLEAALDLGGELVGSYRSVIYLYDDAGQLLEIKAHRNVDAQMLAIASRIPTEEASARALVEQPRPMVIGVGQLPEPHRSVGVGAGVAQVMALPLVARGRLAGIHAFGLREEREFSSSMLATLAAIGEQEAVAINRARAHALAELRAHTSNIVRQVAERLLAAASLADTSEVLLDGMTAICRIASVRLSALDEEGQLRTVASRNATAIISETIDRMRHDDPLGRSVLAMGEPLVLHAGDPSPERALFVEVMAGFGMRTGVVVPLRLGDRLIGLLTASTVEQIAYHPEEVSAMRMLSSVAASALEADRLRRALEGQRNRLGQIIDRIPLPVAVVGARGVFEEVNAAYRAFDPRASRGLPWRSAGGDEDPRAASAPPRLDELNVARCFRAEEPAPVELRISTPRGWRTVVSHTVALPEPSGQVTNVVLALQDVTALRELADAKDRFLDVVSHELRSPLAALRACTTLVELDSASLADPERRGKLVKRVQAQVDRLVKFVDELTDLARIRGGTLELDREPVELTELVQECVDLSQLRSERHRIVVDGSGVVEGLWDRIRLSQVISNLLSNAVRYSPDGGDIVIAVRSDGELAILTVRDPGIGIPPAQLRRLFEPYVRGAQAGALARGGMGLGLYISMEIVRRHGGDIEVESELGRGSRFTVLLPKRAVELAGDRRTTRR